MGAVRRSIRRLSKPFFFGNPFLWQFEPWPGTIPLPTFPREYCSLRRVQRLKDKARRVVILATSRITNTWAYHPIAVLFALDEGVRGPLAV
jgi:hypothetical protein